MTRPNVPHYTQGNVECIDAIRECLGVTQFIAFCKATALAYLWRAGNKDRLSDDLKKARDYINFALESLEQD